MAGTPAQDAEAFKRPHEWERDERGYIVDYGDEHSGPQCIVCDAYACKFCNPGFLDEPCENQDEPLFPVHHQYTDIQKKQRFKELHKLGYVMRGGVVVGRREGNAN
jgi:hypothetical protein